MAQKKPAIKANKPVAADTILLPVAVAKKIFEATGENYFREIVEILVREMHLGLDYAFVGELVDEETIRTLAFYAVDHFRENAEYELEGTPCSPIVSKESTVFTRDVRKHFPNDVLLREMQAESYLGVPLFSAEGSPLGLIAALGRKPVPEKEWERIAGFLQLFAARAGAELDRKRWEDAMRISEENYRAIFDSANDGIFVHDMKTGDVVALNRKASELYGRSLEEFRHFIDDRLFSGLPGYTRQDAMKRIQSAAQGPPQVFEWLSKRKDGSLFWVEVNLKRAVIGGETRLLAVVRDITERKRAEQEIEKTKAQLEEAQQIAGVGNWEWEVASNTLTWSAEMYRIFGVRPHEFSPSVDSVIAKMHPDDRDTIRTIMQEARNRVVKTTSVEFGITRPDGTMRTLYTRLRHEYDDSGILTSMKGTTQDITEQRRAEDTLKLTQFSMDHAAVTAFIIATDARILYANEQASRETGYSREELLSMTIPDLDPNFPHSRWGEHWEQLKRDGFLHFESVHRRKDGALVPVDISVNYLSFGGREYNVGFALDISERKRAENSVRQSYNLTETILDSIGDAITLIDVRDFTIVRANRVFLQKYGFSDESRIAGKHCYEVTHHRLDVCSVADDICPLVESVKKRGHFAVDHVHYDRRGEKIYVEVSTSPISDETGKVIQVVHVQRDITERKRAEAALRESEERFRAFFELAAVGTAQVDPATMKFLRTNRKFCEITGYTAGELRSMTFSDLTHPEDRMDPEAFAETLRPGASAYDAEKRYIRKDGRIVWVHVSATVVRDSGGRPLHTAGIIQDITGRKRMEEEIRHMAHHDALTGLPNRRLFRDIISLELAQAHRNRKKVAVLFLDLDRFKEINDTLGHEAGDTLLQQVASRLRTTLRKSDSMCRIGGDEFNIILADLVRPEDVSDISRKLVDALKNPFLVAAHELHVTASIGISIYPDDSDQMDVLLRYSDIAMYHAKESGRNNFQFYNPSINIRSIERMRLENMLLRSLELGELKIYYQPQVQVSTGSIVCAEALVRWQHPEKGLLLPEEFIAFAEETGFITAIDEFVLKSVCSQIRTWLDAGLRGICVTVNLSSRQFQSPGLIEKFDSLLRETGIPPDCMNIEITESIAMTDVERSAARMRELNGMGITISIDDFGTGYSSLNYLKRLPIKKLKIDKSFVQDIATDPYDRAIISAVTSMAHSMEMKVVAEGVETADQLSFLRKTNCDEAQGFLFSRPVTAEEFARQLAEAK